MANQTDTNFLSPITDAVRFYKDYLGFLIELRKKHGDIAQFKAFNEDIFLISDPEAIEEILIKKTGYFMKGTGYQRGKIILGDGLLTSDFELHDKQRELIMPALSKRQLERFEKIINSETDKFIEKLPVDEYIDFHIHANELFLRIISSAIFSKDDSEEFIQLGVEFGKVFYDYGLFLLAFPKITLKLPLPAVKKFKSLLNRQDELVYGIIEKRTREITERNDLLGYIMNCTYKDGSSMSNKQIRDEAVTLFFAAHDTSARTLCWALYLLCKNPQYIRKIENQASNSQISVKDFETNKFTRWCILEALRIYPPAHSISRIAVKDFPFKDIMVTKGTSVLILPYLIHRDDRYYPDPMKFFPERWENNQPVKTVFLPFGAGNRYCIGDGFAMFQLSVAILKLCNEFDFELKPKQDMEESASLTLKPKHGMKIKFQKKPS